MSRAARKIAAAAEALQAWLDSQPKPVRPPPGSPVEPAQPGSADHPAQQQAATFAPADQPAPVPAAAVPLAAAAPLATAGPLAMAAPLRLAHTDWLYHRLSVTGPAAALARFVAAAGGAGVIPWQLALDRLAEDVFHLLAAPPAPQRRSLSLAGARILADQLCQAVAHRHTLALCRVGHSRACPLDLHALLPVPAELLRRGPDDPAALAWLWTHWGTTEALRHVCAVPGFPDAPSRLSPGEAAFHATFWSADWTPWRAFSALAQRWPTLRFVLCPRYDLA